MTTSASIRAEQDRRRPSASGTRREKRISGSLNGDRLALDEDTPCLANSPSATSTWQRPHRPRPPQTESMSTPRLRAACSTGVPTGKLPRLPEGVKTTSGSRVAMRIADLRPAAGDGRLRAGRAALRVARGGDGGRTGTGTDGASRKRRIQRAQSGIVAQHDVRAHARP